MFGISLQFNDYYDIKKYSWNEGIAPLIPNFSSRWRYMITLTPLATLALGKVSGTQWTGGWVAPQLVLPLPWHSDTLVKTQSSSFHSTVLKGFYFIQGVIIILYSHTAYHCLKSTILVSSMIYNCQHHLFILHTPRMTILHTICVWLTVFLLVMLSHWGRVTQICVFTLQLCKTDDVNLSF